VELFKQPAFSPKTAEVQVALLWAVQNGYVDSIEVNAVVAAMKNLEENLTSAKVELLATIRREKKLSDELTAELKSAIESWKAGYAG
jgi:F-type H+-transporting ATPase subunit alpha